MPSKRMLPVIKTEEGVEAAQSEKVEEKEAGAGGERRRRPNEEEAGVADETQRFRAQVEAQVQAIQGMEHARVMSKELLQAKADVTKLPMALLRARCFTPCTRCPPHTSAS